MEGIHPVGEAVEAGWDLQSVFYSSETLTGNYALGLISRLSTASQDKVHPVSARVMETLADKENPQGLLAVFRQKHTRLESLGSSILSGAALVSVQDPGNLGTILRTLDAVGANGLFLLDGGVDPFHPTCVRASMGAIFWKTLVQASFSEFKTWAKKREVQLIGSSAHASLDFRQARVRKPFILILGNEQKGLSPEQLEACDLTVSIPMRGRASSLNLAVAAGILLYHFHPVD